MEPLPNFSKMSRVRLLLLLLIEELSEALRENSAPNEGNEALMDLENLSIRVEQGVQDLEKAVQGLHMIHQRLFRDSTLFSKREP